MYFSLEVAQRFYYISVIFTIAVVVIGVCNIFPWILAVIIVARYNAFWSEQD